MKDKQSKWRILIVLCAVILYITYIIYLFSQDKSEEKPAEGGIATESAGPMLGDDSAAGATAADAVADASEAASEPGAPAKTLPDTVFCKSVSMRITRQSCEDYEEVERSIKNGRGAFNSPDKMYVNQVSTISLAISFDKKNSVNSETPESLVKYQDGNIVSFNPPVGRYMQAQLEGNGFDISPSSMQQKEIFDNGVTQWLWSVKPTEPGPHTLTITTQVIAQDNSGEKFPLSNSTRTQKIYVLLKTSDRFSIFGQYFLDILKWISAIVAIIAAILVSIRRIFIKRKEKS